MKLILGIGINDKSRPSKGTNNKPTMEYNLWRNMLMRCYSKKIKEKNKTYTECTVSDNFKSYSYFYDWCQNQIGFGKDGYNLDKDLLIKGNKIYSESTCVFIPSEINKLIIRKEEKRGLYPIGVYFDKKRGLFKGQSRNHGKRLFLGYFHSELECFNSYKVDKESYIKNMAEKHKKYIDERSYAALIKYKVEIDD